MAILSETPFIQKRQKKLRKYIRFRDRYNRYVKMILEIHTQGCVFDERRCFETIFKHKKKPKFYRWQILMDILQRKGILKECNT